MPSFVKFNDRLPDPTFAVNGAGAQTTATTGKTGPGFASVALRSKKDTQVSRTNSGRGVAREQGYHVWEMDINYHPMPREDFDVVASFLDARNSRLYPFYVVLPQHSKPKDVKFASTAINSTIRTSEAKTAGASFIGMDINNGATSFSTTGSGYPSYGDFFNIYDSTDLNHQKTYKITRVETTADFNIPLGGPAVNTVRVHFTPPLTRDTPNDAQIIFNNPTFRVMMRSDVLEYQLSTDNLYQFQLQLEEILV